MKIKRFDEINEKSNVAKAIAAGYHVGDSVYNNIIKKYMTIAPMEMDTTKYGDTYCSLGAIGENPKIYSKDTRGFKTEYSTSHLAKDKWVTSLKENIDYLLHNKHYTVLELKKLISDYIETTKSFK
jgi:hypothetical protein